jgi:hypothetical protein
MKGGVFLAQGSESCVYRPTVNCENPPGPLPDGEFVSRIMLGNKEAKAQEYIKKYISQLNKRLEKDENAYRYLGRRPFPTYFNLAVATCTPVFKPEDLLDKGEIKSCKTGSRKKPLIIDMPGPRKDLTNLITPLQQYDIRHYVAQYPEEILTVIKELRKFFHAVIYLNGEGIIHADAHTDNIGWMSDHVVLYDWGSACIGSTEFVNFLNYWRLDHPDQRWEMGRRYRQFALPCLIMDICTFDTVEDSERIPRFVVNDGILRFMKLYDVASMSGSLLFALSLINKHEINAFVGKLCQLWQTVKTPFITAELHKLVDELFDKIELANQPTPDPEAEISPVSPLGGGLNQTQRFCKCIKKVRKTVKNEKGPIAICVSSVLHTRGRTLKRFKCGRHGRVITQKPKLS